jgi:MFS family permease
VTKIEPQQTRSLWVLFTTGLLFWTSIAILLPTLPAYLDKIGIDRLNLGWIIGAFAIGLLITRPIVGTIADTKGRKIVLIIGTIVAGISPLGYLTITSVPHLICLRIFHGLSIAAFTTAYSALVVDIAPPQRRGEIVGHMSLANPVGVAIGPAIGGYLQSIDRYDIVFWVSVICGLISTLGASQLREAPRPEFDPQSSDNFQHRLSFWQILLTPALSIPTLVLLLIGFPFGALHTFVPLYIQASKIDLNPGLFYAIAAAASFSARSVIGSRSDRYGRGIFIAGSLCCYTLGVACLASGRGRMSFILGAILEGLGTGTLIPMTIALVADRSRPQDRGKVISTCIAGLDLGIAIAGPLFGALSGSIGGYGGIFSYGTCLAAMAIAIFLLWGNTTIRRSIDFSLGRDRDYYRLG